MPVEFLTDEQASAYARFSPSPPRVELERWGFLDDADLELVGQRRGDHSRLGFALQLVTVRALGTFLPDPLDVPAAVLDFVAGQVGVEDASVVKRYTERRRTRFEHQTEIAAVHGYRDFAGAEAQLAGWVDDRSWTTGDGPKVLFDGAVVWLRERRVLLPGVSTLARLVARTREEATRRLHEHLSAQVDAPRARALREVLETPDGTRVSALERLRHGPRTATGAGMVKALARVTELDALGMDTVDVSGVPPRRLVELARYGLAAKAPALRRHPYHRKLATLVATVRWLQVKAVDDALELFDVLMTTELLGRAERESAKERLSRFPRLSKHASRLAAAVEVLLEAAEWGEGEAMPLELVWDAIENVVSRAELRAAVASVTDALPPPDADPDGEWRAALVERFASVRGFVPLLCQRIEFGATEQGTPVLEALRVLPDLLATRPGKTVPAGWLDERKVAADVVPGGWWRRLVFPTHRPAGTVAKAAYVFCVLEGFHRLLKRCEVFAVASQRWADPRAALLAGQAWEQARPAALNALQLPEQPDAFLAAHAAELDAAWRGLAGALDEGAEVRLDPDGRLHAAAVTAIADPPSLTDLRARLAGMVPWVDLPELVLEVMGWHPEFLAAFTAASGAQPGWRTSGSAWPRCCARTR